MNVTTLPAFELTGLHIHTTWHNNQAKHDLAKLWRRFYLEDVTEQLDFSLSDDVYLVYTDYEQDSEKGFSVWLGMQTDTEAPLPSGFRRLKIPELTYCQFEAASELAEDVKHLWEEIHAQEAALQRNYHFDLEVYPDGENAQILVSVNQTITAN